MANIGKELEEVEITPISVPAELPVPATQPAEPVPSVPSPAKEPAPV